MNTSKKVIKSEHIMFAEAEQGTQTLVGPQVASFQIAHPQAQLTRSGGELHEFLALPNLGLGPTAARALHKQACDHHSLQDENK